MSGITATREVKRREPGTRVLLLSTLACERDAMEGFAAGADGFALKTEPIDTLLQAFRAVGSGGRYVTPGLRGLKPGDSFAFRPDDARSSGFGVLRDLSPREREVLDLVLKGLRNRQIAKELCISMKTIDTHRTRINRKLGCTGYAGLVRFAADNGLLRCTKDTYERAGEPPTIVLLIDDEPGSRVEMLREIAALGCSPTHAASLRSAVEELRRRKAGALFVVDANGAAPELAVPVPGG
jgi:DNA-binding NarL/FixJ family response regulator